MLRVLTFLLAVVIAHNGFASFEALVAKPASVVPALALDADGVVGSVDDHHLDDRPGAPAASDAPDGALLANLPWQPQGGTPLSRGAPPCFGVSADPDPLFRPPRV
ncbi:hypothetical protein [Aquabacterium sp. J223]|uniref:hypothetical protein n=1 Tax=Aquabacterium sp. J223 TaxID=2898431 RepID=UPI0021AD6CC6|nr:hypothetical protein [Aquabacterium sp. J223]UUX95404.1 hypothetical protein LRS07_19680 [Aquabacterium sp. J223]